MIYLKIFKYYFKKIKGEVVDIKLVSYLSEKRAVDKVASLDFDIYYGKDIVGNISLILTDNPYTFYYGNVGYEIYSQYRGHHFAYYACLMVFDVAKQLGRKDLIITCNVENIASKKTIERSGAIFIERVDVPKNHPLYFANEKEKLVYKVEL